MSLWENFRLGLITRSDKNVLRALGRSKSSGSSILVGIICPLVGIVLTEKKGIAAPPPPLKIPMDRKCHRNHT